MSIVTNPLQACNDIFFKPNGVFKAIDENNNWSWVAFILVVTMSLLPAYLYINFVDFEWYKNMLVDTQYGDKSPAEKDMFREGMELSQVKFFMMVGGVLGPIVVNSILALYLNLMTRSAEENLNGYTDWYGFTWWASMPVVIGGLIAIALIAFNGDPQTLPTIISPLSLAYWFNVSMGSEWFAFTQSVRLESIWSIYLITVGVAQWTKFSAQKSLIIAAGPFVVIWVVWLMIKVLF